jgi:hypothetical protein
LFTARALVLGLLLYTGPTGLIDSAHRLTLVLADGLRALLLGLANVLGALLLGFAQAALRLQPLVTPSIKAVAIHAV